MKIAINNCFGGFGLSDEAMMRYAELKGMTLYPEDTGSYKLYWTCPADQREKEGTGRESIIFSNDIPRDDIHLIQVIEELGEKANGNFSDLKITEIPDDVDWYISEYDGNEHVAENHRTWY